MLLVVKGRGGRKLGPRIGQGRALYDYSIENYSLCFTILMIQHTTVIKGKRFIKCIETIYNPLLIFIPKKLKINIKNWKVQYT